MAATIAELIRITGGAAITFKGRTFFAKDSVNVSIRTERFDAANQYGAPTPLLRRAVAEISFTPHGDFVQADIDALFKFQRWTSADTVESASWGLAKPGDFVAPKQGAGTELLGDITVTPLRAGQDSYVFYRGECLAPPQITFSMTRTMLGQVTLTAFGKMPDVALAGTAASNHLFTATAGSGGQALTALTPPRVGRFDLAWGTVFPTGGLKSYAEDGIVFQCEPQLEEVSVDGFASPIMMVNGVRATVRCRVGNLTDALVQSIINAHNGVTASSNLILGTPMNIDALVNDLTVVNDANTMKVVLKDARVFTVNPVWELRNSRAGELVFENVRAVSTGTPGTLANVFENGSGDAGILVPAA